MTLRHYDEIGLLKRSSVGANGYRHYDQDALTRLQREKERLDRQIGAVESTITKLEGKEQLMAEEMFDGFGHTQYKDEVEEL